MKTSEENTTVRKIPVTCKGSKTIGIDELINFQGNLKTLGKEEEEKIRRSILKYGFFSPVFVWGLSILDGHQRIFVVRQMLSEGYTIDQVPVVEIEARSSAEAAEKLLILNSRYSKITNEGLLDFSDQYGLQLSDLEINIDGLQLEEFDGIDEKSTLQDVSELDVAVGKRKLGDENRKIRPVLYAKDIKDFERAIMSVGVKNYADALMEICRFYLMAKEGA